MKIVVNQFYDPEILGKEYVMRGNAAILKCTIPSFVADFVHVIAWIDDEGIEYTPSADGKFDGGNSFLIEKKNSDDEVVGYLMILVKFHSKSLFSTII